MKKFMILLSFFLLVMVTFTGCSSQDDTIQTCIIANTEYATIGDLDEAKQEEELAAEKSVYASIHFIESPKGMEYTVTWYLEDTEVKSETKATTQSTQDVVIYELEAEQAVAGTWKLEVIYKDTILLTKNFELQ